MVLIIYYTLFGERDDQETIQFQAAINPMKKNKLE